jgi:hypothetical protein
LFRRTIKEIRVAALSRFDELRSKTDKQLLRVINNAIDLGLCEARQALRSADNRPFGQRHYAKAKRAYAEACYLISLADAIAEEQQGRARLDHLREMLEGLSFLNSIPAPAGESPHTLARALWKARGCPESSAEEDWFQAERALKSQPACVGG